MTEQADFETLLIDPNVDVARVQVCIDEALEAIADDPSAYDVPASAASIAMRARQDEAQSGAAEAIVIAVVGGVAQEVLKTIWNNVVWPALRDKFGDSVRKAD